MIILVVVTGGWALLGTVLALCLPQDGRWEAWSTGGAVTAMSTALVMPLLLLWLTDALISLADLARLG